jgi:DNA-binding MarR family transcriptional regulator
LSDTQRAYSGMDVATTLRRLDLAMSQMHLEMSERLGLSPAEFLALANLSVDGRLGPTDLAHRLHMTTGAMTAMLDRLTERRFVIREPHPSDRRRITVRLTEEGRDSIFTRVHSMADDLIAIAQRLEPEERGAMVRFLEEVSGVVTRSGS